jgi:phenylalanine ammonia-lyase
MPTLKPRAIRSYGSKFQKLNFRVQAVDLRTYTIAGHYDARACLSPETLELYVAVHEAIDRRFSADQLYIWNDHEQALDDHTAHITADIKAEGKIMQAINKIVTSLR